MTGVQIGNEFLELPQGTIIEIESENPLLQFNQEILGEYSYPFPVKITDNNNRLLGYAGIPQKWVDTAGVDAILYDKSLQVGGGKVKIERVNSNFNRIHAGTMDCYFLGKASSFYQDAKDISLRAINAGGDRTFDWDGYVTTGTGFWKHLNDVFFGNPNDFDYAFFPVRNENAITTLVTSDFDYDKIINKVYFDVVNDRFINRGMFCPFPYLHYILKKAVEHVGWRIQGDFFDDETFRKITILNFTAIDWAYIVKDGGVINHEPYAEITFNLNNHLPDIKIGEFLIAIRNKLGLHLDFDSLHKIITVSLLDSIADMEGTDYTNKAGALIPKSITQENTIYGLKYSDGRGELSLGNTIFQGEIATRADLPAAAEALHDQSYYISLENKYLICLQNEDNDDWDWQVMGDNNMDYLPEGNNEDITTSALIPGMEIYTDFYSRKLMVPRVDEMIESIHNSYEPTGYGLYLCHHLGLSNLDNPDPVDLYYPLGSASVFDMEMNQLADWGLTFTCFKPDGTDIGIYKTFWERFLAIIGNKEQFEVPLYLPMHEYLQLKFSDRIIISGIEMFIRQIRTAIPYKGNLTAVCTRV